MHIYCQNGISSALPVQTTISSATWPQQVTLQYHSHTKGKNLKPIFQKLRPTRWSGQSWISTVLCLLSTAPTSIEDSDPSLMTCPSKCLSVILKTIVHSTRNAIDHLTIWNMNPRWQQKLPALERSLIPWIFWNMNFLMVPRLSLMFVLLEMDYLFQSMWIVCVLWQFCCVVMCKIIFLNFCKSSIWCWEILA